jgi:autotransporter-associated beta strand protein
MASNWVQGVVPDGTATFGISDTTDISVLLSLTEVDKIIFSPGASSYDITALPAASLNFERFGIVNNSGIEQNFSTSSEGSYGIGFIGASSAGIQTVFTIASGGMGFGNSANADQATVINLSASTVDGSYGVTAFDDQTNAAMATITNEAGQGDGASGGLTLFRDTSKGGSAVITCEGASVSGAQGGLLEFSGSAHGDAATLIANGGSNGAGGGEIDFTDSASGDTARVELFGNGMLNIVQQLHGVTIGSLEGDGMVSLGSSPLTVGSNNLSTTFSGVLGEPSSTGSILKTGTVTWTLTGESTYYGGTTVNQGTLVVSNTAGSATGNGPVFVNAGTLSGSGIIAGSVTIGTGRGTGAFLAPAAGGKKQLTLTIQSALTFKADATYTYTFKAKQNKAKTDKVIANGVTINGGAMVNLSGQTQGSLKRGLTLTMISNTSASPISGTFSNLPDGGIVNVNGNNFQASYSGGDGNDLTLTVVP